MVAFFHPDERLIFKGFRSASIASNQMGLAVSGQVENSDEVDNFVVRNSVSKPCV